MTTTESCGWNERVDAVAKSLPGWTEARDALSEEIAAECIQHAIRVLSVADAVDPLRRPVYPGVQDDTDHMAQLLSIAVPEHGDRVYEWPADEAAAYRDNDGFSAGRAAVQKIRWQKAARILLAAGYRKSNPQGEPS